MSWGTPKPRLWLARPWLSVFWVALTATALSIAAFGIGPAHAITCRGNEQLSGGRWIVTPYCEDQTLTRVAREFGIRVSFDTIRFNPNEKARICGVIGHDGRVANTCAPYRNEGGRRWIP